MVVCPKHFCTRAGVQIEQQRRLPKQKKENPEPSESVGQGLQLARKMGEEKEATSEKKKDQASVCLVFTVMVFPS